MRYFVANWKANKNLDEALEWIDTFLSLSSRYDHNKIIVCPPSPLIYPLKQKLNENVSIYLGAQDISAFEEGSYTGEVTAKSLEGLVEYTIIGHSERREYFKEDDETLFKKTNQAKKYGIEPIFCIRDEKDKIPDGVQIVAYEPVYAIGSGNNEPLEKVIALKDKLTLPKPSYFLYGGSVEANNASSYLKPPEVDGFLIGGASLDPNEFFQIINSG